MNNYEYKYEYECKYVYEFIDYVHKWGTELLAYLLKPGIIISSCWTLFYITSSTETKHCISHLYQIQLTIILNNKTKITVQI